MGYLNFIELGFNTSSPIYGGLCENHLAVWVQPAADKTILFGYHNQPFLEIELNFFYLLDYDCN